VGCLLNNRRLRERRELLIVVRRESDQDGEDILKKRVRDASESQGEDGTGGLFLSN